MDKQPIEHTQSDAQSAGAGGVLNHTCAVLGQHPMRFPWGFDEEDCGCQDLKLALAQKIMELASHRKTPECEYDAYRKIIDYADMVLAVYDAASARGDAVDWAMEYAKERGLPMMLLQENE